jgi:hypothetical protein
VSTNAAAIAQAKLGTPAATQPFFGGIRIAGVKMRALFELAPVIADIISAHCPGTSARSEFVAACIREDWYEATSMIEGMLAEPWVLRGYQETRLREFLDLLQATEGVHAMATVH